MEFWDRITPTQAIALLDSPITLAEQVEDLDDLEELYINHAVESIQEHPPLPYSEYVVRTSHPDTFTSWISPFLDDSNCTRPAIALSIPYLDHTGPQRTSDKICPDIGGDYIEPHPSYNRELTHFPEPRPYINYELVQVLFGIALDYGHLDRNDERRFAYLQQGRDRYYEAHAEFQKASQTLQSVIVAAEMMEEKEWTIKDEMTKLEEPQDDKMMKAQAGTEPDYHISENITIASSPNLSCKRAETPLQPISPPALDTTDTTPSTSICEDSAITGETTVLNDQLFANHSFRNRNFYEMGFHEWKFRKLLKQRDRASEILSALKRRFCENELPFLLKVGNQYCRQEEAKERLCREKIYTAEEDIDMEMEDAGEYGEVDFMNE